MREQTFFHASEEYQREFQPLGAVQGHQLHAVLALGGLLLAGFQCGMVEEGRQYRLTVILRLEASGGADQFLQVLHPRLAFLTLFAEVEGDQPGVFEGLLDLHMQRLAFAAQRQLVDQLDEGVQRTGGTTRHQLAADHLVQRLPQRQALGTRQFAHHLDSLVADAARRQVDDALQRSVVGALAQQAQVAQRVPDLGALEEALAAVDAVRNLLAQQFLFQHPRLGVGAVQDRHLAALEAVLAHRVLDALADEARFIAFVVGGVQGQRIALAAIGPQFLAEAALIVGDQCVGSLEDGVGGAVVLFQPDGDGIVEVAPILADVLDARAAPAVDRLVVIADHHQAGAGFRRHAGQVAQPGVLHGVGVLELVDQQVTEAALIVGEQAGVVAPQLVGAQQQLGKIHHVGAAAGLFVGHIHLQLGGEIQIADRLDVLRTVAFILLAIDEPLQLARWPLFLVQPQLAHHALDQSQLVIGVEDLEVLAEAGFLPVCAQQTVRQPMEGADPHAGRVYTEQFTNAQPHLGGSLVGEGNREDAVRAGVLDLDQPGDAVHQHPGLARAGTGQHQLATERSGDSLALGIIEGVEQKGEVFAHCGILGCAGSRSKHQFRKRPIAGKMPVISPGSNPPGSR